MCSPNALTSVFAILALAASRWWGWHIADPLMGIVGAGVVLVWAVKLVRATAPLLLDVAPARLVADMRAALGTALDGEVIDIHVWSIAPECRYASVVLVAHRETHRRRRAPRPRAVRPRPRHRRDHPVFRSALLTVVLTLGLVGCGGGDPPTPRPTAPISRPEPPPFTPGTAIVVNNRRIEMRTPVVLWSDAVLLRDGKKPFNAYEKGLPRPRGRLPSKPRRAHRKTPTISSGSARGTRAVSVAPRR
jgi:hypothetical protein